MAAGLPGIVNKDRKTLGSSTKHKPASELFKDADLIFYIDPSLTTQLNKTLRSILDNSGVLVKNLECVKDRKIKVNKLYCLIPDGGHDIANKIVEVIGKEKAVMISPRWVDFCIDRNTVVKDFKEKRLVHLSPAHLKTPYPAVVGIRFYPGKFLTFEEKSIFAGMIRALGGTVVETYSEG